MTQPHTFVKAHRGISGFSFRACLAGAFLLVATLLIPASLGRPVRGFDPFHRLRRELSADVLIGYEFVGNGSVDRMDVDIRRSARRLDLRFDISGRITATSEEWLRSATFRTANDRDGDGIIAPDEWTIVASAHVEHRGGLIVATFLPTRVDLDVDAYGLFVEDKHGTFRTCKCSKNLEIADP